MILLQRNNFVNSLVSLFQTTHDVVKIRMVSYQALCSLLELDHFSLPSAFLSREFIHLVIQDFQMGHFELNSVIGKYICRMVLLNHSNLSKESIEMVSFSILSIPFFVTSFVRVFPFYEIS